MATALITGISGFLAGHLAKRLRENCHDVVGVGRRSSSFAPEIRHVPLDICDSGAVDAVFDAERPELVFHLAALATLQDAGTSDGVFRMLSTNVGGTVSVLEAARKHGAKAVVVASSDKQYGALAPTPYDDSDATAFENGGVYELSKAQQDQSARLFAGVYDAPAIRVVRYANLYGPGDTTFSRIVPGTIRRALNGQTPRLTAGPAGAALREYVFVDDAVDATLALTRDALSRGNGPLRRVDGKLARVAFNVGSEHRFAAKDVIATIQNVLKTDFGIDAKPPEIAPAAPSLFEPGSQLSRLDRLRELLPTYNPRALPDGLRATIPWYVEQLNG